MDHRQRVAMLLAPACVVTLIGCADSEEEIFGESAVKSEMSRTLDPPVGVDSDADIGTSIETLREQATQESDATYSPTVASCVMQHYEHEGLVIAVYEYCTGSHRKLYVYEWGEENGETVGTLERVFGDLDDDEIVDAWFDPAEGGLKIEDLNFDDAVDARTDAFERLGDDYVIQGFEAGWIPPEYPEERILWDTDFDGYYDRETITGGEDPQGNPSYWRKG